jgi:hypothetical protein
LNASSTCLVEPVGSVSLVHSNTALLLDGSDLIRVRFSVQGLTFRVATVYLQARSYSTNSSTNIRVWSPLYGERVVGPVDQDFVFDWYSMDWSDKLFASDAPALTAIQIYPHLGSASLAVRAVELCLQ